MNEDYEKFIANIYHHKDELDEEVYNIVCDYYSYLKKQSAKDTKLDLLTLVSAIIAAEIKMDCEIAKLTEEYKSRAKPNTVIISKIHSLKTDIPPTYITGKIKLKNRFITEKKYKLPKGYYLQETVCEGAGTIYDEDNNICFIMDNPKTLRPLLVTQKRAISLDETYEINE